MRKKFLATSVALLTTSIGGQVCKEAYEFGRKICYRESFEDLDMTDFIEEHDIKKVRIKNQKGLLLQGYLIERENADKTIMIAHPFNESSLAMEKYIEYFEKLVENTNILLFDANGHGNSDGYLRGFGYRDVTDLMYWNTYVLQKFGEDHSIIMFGKEMGATMILNTAGMHKLKNVKAIISEGAYDRVDRYLGYKFARNTQTMNFVIPIIQRAIKDEVSWDIKKMNTIKLVEKNEIPTLFIHSQKDFKVPFSSVLGLYNHNHSTKELFPIKEKYLYQVDDQDDYTQIIKEFLTQYV